jgi:hypothetical protein
MTEFGTGGAAAVLIAITKFNATILAGQNSVTVTHNLGRLAKVNGVFGLDDNASAFIVKNEGVNSFDVAFQTGIVQVSDTLIEGTFV